MATLWYKKTNTLNTMTVQLNFYDKSGALYLVYTFENERPSNACYVSARRQGVPSKHSLTVTVDGKEVIVKKRGFILTKNGRQKGKKDLPIQKARVLGNPLMGLKVDASTTDRSLAKKVWKQYGKVRVQFERLNEFYEARDVQFDGTAAVYMPIRVVVHKAV